MVYKRLTEAVHALVSTWSTTVSAFGIGLCGVMLRSICRRGLVRSAGIASSTRFFVFLSLMIAILLPQGRPCRKSFGGCGRG